MSFKKGYKMKKLYFNHLKTIIKCVLLEDAILEGGTTKCSVCGAPVNAKDLASKEKSAACPYCKNPYNWESYIKKHSSEETISPAPEKIGGSPGSDGGFSSTKPTPQEEGAIPKLGGDVSTSVDVAKMFYVEMKEAFLPDIIGPGQIKEMYGFYQPIIRIGGSISENAIKSSIKSAYSRLESDKGISPKIRKVNGVIVNGKYYSFDELGLRTPEQASTQKRTDTASSRATPRGKLFGPLSGKR